jgi:hypothetical protein
VHAKAGRTIMWLMVSGKKLFHNRIGENQKYRPEKHTNKEILKKAEKNIKKRLAF